MCQKLSFECSVCMSYTIFVYILGLHFIFASIILFNFRGYATLKNCFEFSFDIFIYKSMKRYYKLFYFIKVLITFCYKNKQLLPIFLVSNFFLIFWYFIISEKFLITKSVRSTTKRLKITECFNSKLYFHLK